MNITFIFEIPTALLTLNSNVCCETGINSGIRYSIRNDIYNSTDNFHVDPEDGSIYLKRSLDHETRRIHHFIVVATDMGLPPLSTTAHVWLTGKYTDELFIDMSSIKIISYF